jgi:hypothetical protein
MVGIALMNFVGMVAARMHYTVDMLVAIPTCICIYSWYFHTFIKVDELLSIQITF